MWIRQCHQSHHWWNLHFLNIILNYFLYKGCQISITKIKCRLLHTGEWSHFIPVYKSQKMLRGSFFFLLITSTKLQVFGGKGEWDRGSEWELERDIFTELKASTSASHRPTLLLPRSAQAERQSNLSITETEGSQCNLDTGRNVNLGVRD